MINIIENLFEELINSNLKNSNIIILGLDIWGNNNNEGIDLKLININRIDQYAKVLNENEHIKN